MSNDRPQTEFVDHGFEGLMKLVDGDLDGVIKVGILGDGNTRKGDGGNADVGWRHEFGDGNLPIRSFLRMPLTTKLQKELSDAGMLDKETLEAVLLEEDLVVWLKEIGIMAESVISKAFSSGGFGTWKPSDMRYKKIHQTLVESAQLRDSINHEVTR